MEVVFVRTRHNYDSYTDFWKLVELSGFPIIFTDEVDVREHKIFITAPMNGEWRPHIDNQSHRPRNAHLILWNLERPSGSSGSVGNYAAENRKLLDGRYVDDIWVSDRRLAEETTTRFVVLGAHPDLGKVGNLKSYDITHMSYMNGRRQTIFKHFKEQQIGRNCWPPERDDILQRSRFAVNVHQDNHPFQEPLRFALFAAYGLPIISESIYDAFPWGEEDTMIFSPYEGLVGKINQMLNDDYEKWGKMGKRARRMMTSEYRFDKMVEGAIEGSVYQWK